MAKTSGGVRNVSPHGKAYRERLKEVGEMRASGKYSSVEMAHKGTGYVAMERSNARHTVEEIEAARHLANAGYKVILKNEAGNVVTPDGYTFRYSYEQRTPQGSSVRNAENALVHAMYKGAEVALIYDKHAKYVRSTVESGIKQYEAHYQHRFKNIIVIGNTGRVHVHKHNK